MINNVKEAFLHSLLSSNPILKNPSPPARCFASRSSTTRTSFRDPNLQALNKRISLLTLSGRISEARALFNSMENKNIVSWNSMISGYVKRKEIIKARKLFDEMPEKDTVSWNLMVSGYMSCRVERFLEDGRSLFESMPEKDCVSWNTMISGYAKNGKMSEALRVFNATPDRNVVSWNAMISGFLNNGDVVRAVEFFERMPERDAASLGALVSGLIRNGRLDEAARLVSEFRRSGGEEGLVYAYNTLIAGFGQRGRIQEARKTFEQIPFGTDGKRKRRGGSFERNMVSWNTMIMCYIKAGDVVSARKVFNQMVDRDIFSWNTMISGYVQVSDMDEASKLFGMLPNPDTLTWNMMVTGYAQKGNLELAYDFFKRMPQKSLVSWNSIISGYEKNEDYTGALKLFIQMQVEGEKPDLHTLSSVLSASTGIVDLLLGAQIHQLITKTVVPDVPINNALITMYSRCGALMEARSIFDEMILKKEVISWNAIIGGYASHGYGSEALNLFQLMERYDVKPTYITFISVLSACANAGLAEEGKCIFNSMVTEYGIEPGIEHFASLVDILGRHGQLDEAFNLINNMPFEPDKAVWGSLLSAARIHNNMEMARIAAQALMKLEPENSAAYVLLYNMYADIGQWDKAIEVRMVMERNEIKKQAASSWVNFPRHD